MVRLFAPPPIEEITALTRALVAFPTRNPPGEERACAEFIFDTLRSWGIAAELVTRPQPQRPQVVAWVQGEGGAGPTLILNGHIDTVPEGDADQWPYPPFEAAVADNHLYGLGTADMKSQLAVGMLLLKAVRSASSKLRGTLMFQAAMGEELAEAGTRTLLQNPRYRGDFAVVMEPTNLQIAPCTRGVAWHRIVLKGIPEHCGLAERYADPIVHLAQLVERLQAYHHLIRARTHPLLRSPACVITQVQAGDKHNHIAGRCEVVVDRRMLPGERTEQVRLELLELLEALANDIPDFDYELEFLRDNEPAEIETDHSLVRAIQQAAAAVTGRTPAIWGPPYGSDVRNFILDAGIPAVNFGPGDFSICHTPQERVSLQELARFAEILTQLIHDLLVQPQALPAH
jgi:succinyl-diaminopimelate desuccinylase